MSEAPMDARAGIAGEKLGRFGVNHLGAWEHFVVRENVSDRLCTMRLPKSSVQMRNDDLSSA